MTHHRIFLVTALCLPALAAPAAQVNWAVPSGLYTNGTNRVGGSVPAAADQAAVQNGGTGIIDSATNAVTELWAGNGSGTTGALAQVGGTLNVSGWLVVGRSGTSVGSYTLSGGTLDSGGTGGTVIGDVNGGSGTFTLAGSGAFNHTGTDFCLGGTAAGAGTGTLRLDNACLSPGSSVAIAPAAFLDLQFAATNRIARLFVGAAEQSPGVYRQGTLPQLLGTGSLLVTGGRPPGTLIKVR